METHLQDYLQSVGIIKGIDSTTLACEVCGSHAHEVLVEQVETVDGRFDKLPVVCCCHCGFVYQNPRFNKHFYDIYYEKYYRLMLFGDSQPDKDFVLDQVRRGEHLYRNLAQYLPAQGKLLDVGCSAGGLMAPFAKRGWEVLGTDPDSAYVEFGKKRLGLRIEAVSAEDMDLPQAYYDLIIITGSLEHVFDVNRVLALCRRACAPDGLLFIEGRALNYGFMKGFFSHNHRRYLTATSIELLMLRHGWEPILASEDPLCGPTRPDAIHVLGRASEPVDLQLMQEAIGAGRRDDLDDLKRKCAALRSAA